MESDPRQPATLLMAANGTAIDRNQLDAFVDHQMRELQIPGLALAVIGDGRILYTAARGVANLDSGEPLTPESVFEVASLSKPVFAWLVLQQVAAGLIDLDVPLHQYQALPELADDPRHLRIT
ncbi:MAG: beta-lactamase family protein, partial [Xanthomonadales bacterium]|nr:beta-lactamase family protein [Xanthomonadales bacterium]